MNQGQSQIAGAVERTVTIGDREYTLAVPSAREVRAGFEQHWHRHQPDVYENAAKACEKAPPEMHATIWAETIKLGENRKPTPAELNAFANTDEGISYLLWICLKKHHVAELKTYGDVMELLYGINDAKLTEIMQKTEIITGEAEAKN